MVFFLLKFNYLNIVMTNQHFKTRVTKFDGENWMKIKYPTGTHFE